MSISLLTAQFEQVVRVSPKSQENQSKIIQLSTTKITTSKNIEVVKKVLAVWKQKLNRFIENERDESQKELLEDSLFIVKKAESAIKEVQKPESKEETYSIYIACNSSQKIQGIAVKKLASYEESKLHPLWLEYLVTCPESKKGSGVGRALVKHIVTEMKGSNEAKELHTIALPSSVSFFTNLGFAKRANTIDDTIDWMTLAANQVDTFLKNHEKIAGIAESKPTIPSF